MGPPTTAGPLRVDIIGANQRMRDTLIMVFRGPAKEACRLAEGQDAEAVVVNLDGVGAAAEWARYRERFPQRPAIALSLNGDPVEHAAAVVAKPVRIEQFLAAVTAVKTNLLSRRAPAPETKAAQTHARARDVTSNCSNAAERPATGAFAIPHSHPPGTIAAPGVAHEDGRRRETAEDAVCGIHPDVDAADPDQLEPLRYGVAQHLLAHARAAVRTSFEQGTATAIVIAGKSILTVSARDRCARSMLSDERLVPLCTRAWPDTQIAAAADGIAPSGVATSLEALMWKLALWTYRGRLPEDAPVRERVYLRHWPNLSRLLPCPNALRIAALLVRQPMQLVRAATALRIPQRHVFAFYAAAAAIGLAGTARRAADELLEQEAPQPDERRTLIAKIARHLPHDKAPR